MTSPLEHLVHLLDTGPLGQALSLERVIFDDDEGSARDREKLSDYGFQPQAGRPWFYPQDLRVQGRPLNTLLQAVPSDYRRLALDDPKRPGGKRHFEARLQAALDDCQADLVLVDGLLVILDELIRPGAPYHGRVFNIHPGITRADSPFERRGACATLDALNGARGVKILNWQTLEQVSVPPVLRTGASFHHVDNGIDSGEVVVDVLATDIDPADTILELRWNNFQKSLFPAMEQGLARILGLTLDSTRDPVPEKTDKT